MTGLSLENDVLVEIAVLATDSELNVLGEGVDVVIHASAENVAGMNVACQQETSFVEGGHPRGVEDLLR